MVSLIVEFSTKEVNIWNGKVKLQLNSFESLAMFESWANRVDKHFLDLSLVENIYLL